jgi:hypothetical protein
MKQMLVGRVGVDHLIHHKVEVIHILIQVIQVDLNLNQIKEIKE